VHSVIPAYNILAYELGRTHDQTHWLDCVRQDSHLGVPALRSLGQTTQRFSNAKTPTLSPGEGGRRHVLLYRQ
jgi:hypothetical protein